jgi:hypothetical protein
VGFFLFPWSLLLRRLVTTAAAWPISQSMSPQHALAPLVEVVDHHPGPRSGYREGYRRGGFIGAGIGVGALAGRILPPTTGPYGHYGYARATPTRPAVATGTVRVIPMNLISNFAAATERPMICSN